MAAIHWIRAFRLPGQLNLALPMLVGMVHQAPRAAGTGLPLVRGLAISLLLQAMILYSNDASDADTDDAERRTVISGGSGVGAEGALAPSLLRRAAVTAGAVGLLVCLGCGGAWLGAVWLAAAALVWAYDGQLLRLSRRPIGCLCQAVGVGVVAPLLGAGLVAPPVWPPPGELAIGLCLGLSGHIVSALPDQVVDREVGKRTILVWLGAGPSFALLWAGLAAAAALLLAAPAGHWIVGAGAIPTSSLRCVGLGLGLGLLSAWLWGPASSDGAPGSRLRRRRAGGIPLSLWTTGLAALLLWMGWILR